MDALRGVFADLQGGGGGGDDDGGGPSRPPWKSRNHRVSPSSRASDPRTREATLRLGRLRRLEMISRGGECGRVGERERESVCAVAHRMELLNDKRRFGTGSPLPLPLSARDIRDIKRALGSTSSEIDRQQRRSSLSLFAVSDEIRARARFSIAENVLRLLDNVSTTALPLFTRDSSASFLLLLSVSLCR